jgi:uncharacterized LabA/DUF88 family protein
MVGFTPAPFIPSKRIMVFIDGGYLRERLKKMFTTDEVNYGNLIYELGSHASFPGTMNGLVRAYYYDAIPDALEAVKFKAQMDYLRKVKQHDLIEVREGRAVKKGNGSLTQKGVDTLITMDMLTMAHGNQYDVAFLLSGDGDFVDLVYEVKHTGKQVWGAFFDDGCTPEVLRESFDKRYILHKSLLEQWMPKRATPKTP